MIPTDGHQHPTSMPARPGVLHRHPAIQLIVDPESGRLLDANQAAADFYGWSMAELSTMRIWQINTMDEAALTREMQLALTGRRCHFEFQHRRRDGSVRDVAVYSGPVGGPDGEVLHSFIHDISEAKLEERTRAFLLQCGLPATGEEFFPSLARHLAETLGMGYVCIDRLLGDGLNARTLAAYNDGVFESNVDYALRDTPCGEVAERGLCCFPRDVRRRFPRDRALADLRAESYAGITLTNSRGRSCGLIAVIGREPLADPRQAEILLNLVAPRAAFELERLDAEQAARDSHQRMLSVLDGHEDSIYVADPQTYEMLYANRSLVQEQGDPGTRRCYEYLQGRTSPCPFCTNERIFADPHGRTLVWETRNLANGRWYRCHDRAISWPDGRRVRYELAVDITEQRGIQEALRRKHQKELAIARCAAALGGTGSLDLRLSLLVEELQRVTEVSRVYIFQNVDDPELGLCCSQTHESVAPGIRPELDNPDLQMIPYSVGAPSLLPVMLQGRPFSRVVALMGDCPEREFLAAQGILSLLIVPVMVDGGFWGYIGFDDCLEETLWHEEDIAMLAVVAESIGVAVARIRAAEERERLQAQLDQSQKLESVGRLAGGVAHDFNNQLGVILGLAELALQRLDENHEVRGDLLEIHQAGRRGADLTRQLLAFASRQTIEPRLLDLNETVEGLLKMLRRLLGEDVELVFRPGGEVGSVHMDPSQVDQILANLCANARDAIEGAGSLTIETQRAVIDEAFCAHHAGHLPGDFAVLVVSDSGCGMSKEVLEHVFEPFFTTKGQGRGTGLGLATVYGIARQNQGFIHAYSEPGLGSTFKVYLPRHAQRPLPTRPEPRPETETRHHETILLVEDEAAILRMAALMLERLGYTVLRAGNAHEALEVAEAHGGSLDLLLTDVIMPRRSGSELAAELRARRPGLRVLFMSGYTSNVIARHGVLEEGEHFLQKPFAMRALAEKVRLVLDP